MTEITINVPASETRIKELDGLFRQLDSSVKEELTYFILTKLTALELDKDKKYKHYSDNKFSKIVTHRVNEIIENNEVLV